MYYLRFLFFDSNDIIFQISIVFSLTLCICLLTTTAQNIVICFARITENTMNRLDYRYSTFSSKAEFTHGSDARFEMMHNSFPQRIKIQAIKVRQIKFKGKKEQFIPKSRYVIQVAKAIQCGYLILFSVVCYLPTRALTSFATLANNTHIRATTRTEDREKHSKLKKYKEIRCAQPVSLLGFARPQNTLTIQITTIYYQYQ